MTGKDTFGLGQWLPCEPGTGDKDCVRNWEPRWVLHSENQRKYWCKTIFVSQCNDSATKDNKHPIDFILLTGCITLSVLLVLMLAVFFIQRRLRYLHTNRRSGPQVDHAGPQRSGPSIVEDNGYLVPTGIPKKLPTLPRQKLNQNDSIDPEDHMYDRIEYDTEFLDTPRYSQTPSSRPVTYLQLQ